MEVQIGLDTPSWTIHWMRGVSFANSNYGMASGYWGEIVKTTNGGVSWVQLFPYPMGGYLYSVSYIDLNNAIAVGEQGTILKTVNGGSSWTSQLSESVFNHLYDVAFANNEDGLSVGLGGIYP